MGGMEYICPLKGCSFLGISNKYIRDAKCPTHGLLLLASMDEIPETQEVPE